MINPIDIALTALEKEELKSTSWGFIDIHIEEKEAEEIIASGLSENNIDDDPSTLLDTLVKKQLVRQMREGEERVYRTRFSDMLRLLVRLKQIVGTRSWQASPTLVADYRVDIRPRRYPKRNITPDDALDQIKTGVKLSKLQLKLWDVFQSQIKTRGYAKFQIEATKRLLSGENEHGTIITAGTGSGKTMAFYLPAL